VLPTKWKMILKKKLISSIASQIQIPMRISQLKSQPLRFNYQ
jgi:hypothetical protein